MQVIQHGACLGLGLAALGTNDDELFEDIKNVLYLDSAVAGEAAGLALGLLTVGSATDKASELLAYAHDTQHEKVSVSSWRGPATPCQLLQMHEAEACPCLCPLHNVFPAEAQRPTALPDLPHMSSMHLQIIRGIAIGLALIMYGREEGAETLIEQMTRDQDPILRCAQELMCFLHVVIACCRAATAAPMADIQAQSEV